MFDYIILMFYYSVLIILGVFISLPSFSVWVYISYLILFSKPLKVSEL